MQPTSQLECETPQQKIIALLQPTTPLPDGLPFHFDPHPLSSQTPGWRQLPHKVPLTKLRIRNFTIFFETYLFFPVNGHHTDIRYLFSRSQTVSFPSLYVLSQTRSFGDTYTSTKPAYPQHITLKKIQLLR